MQAITLDFINACYAVEQGENYIGDFFYRDDNMVKHKHHDRWYWAKIDKYPKTAPFNYHLEFPSDGSCRGDMKNHKEILFLELPFGQKLKGLSGGYTDIEVSSIKHLINREPFTQLTLGID